MTAEVTRDWLPLILTIVTAGAGWGGMRTIVKGIQEELKEFKQTVITVAMIQTQVRTLEQELNRLRTVVESWYDHSKPNKIG